jgi:ribosome biogenesis protein Tsr3
MANKLERQAEALEDLDERELLMLIAGRLINIERSVGFISTVVAVIVALWVIGLVATVVGALASS